MFVRQEMEASALSHAGRVGLLGRSPALLRLQGDERLVALIRERNPRAFEVLFDRYRARLLAFCRGIVGSTEDAEDVLQDVFVSAHSAMLADERPINVKPWLYRIARNRALNHLRKPFAEGQDTMDVLPHANGNSAADTCANREELRAVFADVADLPETQRTALVLRQVDDLSYEDIAQAMGTTMPAVKSLLVRARMSLAEASEGRVLTCDEVRLELAEAAEGLRKVGGGTRQHIRNCERCRRYRSELRSSTRELRLLAPVGILVALRHLISAKLGGGAGTATAGSGGSAGAGAGATGAAASGASGAAAGGSAIGTGGLIGGGAIGAIGAKAAGGLATAAVLTAGAVGVGNYTTNSTSAPVAAPSASYATIAPPKPRVANYTADRPDTNPIERGSEATPTPAARATQPHQPATAAKSADPKPSKAETPDAAAAATAAIDAVIPQGDTGSTSEGQETTGTGPTASGSSDTGDYQTVPVTSPPPSGDPPPASADPPPPPLIQPPPVLIPPPPVLVPPPPPVDPVPAAPDPKPSGTDPSPEPSGKPAS